MFVTISNTFEKNTSRNKKKEYIHYTYMCKIVVSQALAYLSPGQMCLVTII